VFECSDPSVARSKLAWWRQEIGALYQGAPRHPVTRALHPAVERYRLPESLLQEILDGAEMDVTVNRYRDFEALALQCYRKAGVVAQLCAEILGYEDGKSLESARELGLAVQLSRIIREAGNDARRNRVYLPLDDLAKFDLHPADVLHRKNPDGLARLIEFQIDRAQGYFARARADLPPVDRPAQRSLLILGEIHRVLLEEIRADGCQVLERRITLTPLRKFWIAWRTR